MNKKMFLILIALFLCFGVAYADSPSIKAQSAILTATNSSQIIFEKNINTKNHPAGLTKIMTTVVAFEKFGMDKQITIPQNISDYLTPYEPSMQLKGGEIITSGNLMYAMIMGSANDAAFALALADNGDTEAFVTLMNNKAKTLGLKNTKFVNITGNRDDEQYTTANDMATLYRYVLSVPQLKEIMSRVNYTIPATNSSNPRRYWSNNHLISRYYETKYVYPFAVSGKTASSSAGGYSVISSAEKGNMSFICVILNSSLDENVNYSMVDAKEIYEYGFNNYTLKRLVTAGDVLLETKVKNAIGNDHTILTSNKTVRAYILKEDDISKIEKKNNIPKYISAPLEKGQIVGTIDYIYKGKTIGQTELSVSSNIKLNVLKYIGNSILWFLNLKIIRTILLLVLLTIIIYVCYVIYIIKKASKQKKRK